MKITEYMANRHAEAVRRREEREQAANSLTFACSKVPESNLTVNILIVG